MKEVASCTCILVTIDMVIVVVMRSVAPQHPTKKVVVDAADKINLDIYTQRAFAIGLDIKIYSMKLRNKRRI